MHGLTIALFWLLAAGLILMMIAQGLSRRVDLFSIRNIYLVGFIIYAIVSPATALQSGNFCGFRINDPDRAGRWMLAFTYIYAIVYLLSYHRIRASHWLAAKFSGGRATVSDSMLTGVAIGLVLAALAMRIAGVHLPFLYALSTQLAVALLAAACAIIGWVWGARRLNPAVLLVAALVIGAGLMLSLTIFSRRPLIGVTAGFVWGAYFRWARLLPPGRLLLSTLPLVLGGAVIVSAFTAIRNHNTGNTAAQDTFKQMAGADLKSGTANLLSGQACGSAALWILEKYPREIRYEPLFSFRYMGYWYVPRVLWDDKPEPLSQNIANLAKIRGVNRDLITMPPNVIGYAAAEGGFYALVLYALFYGQFTRLFDELIRRNVNNPLVILPIGCAMGQFMGLARGDLAIFTNLAIVGVVSAYLMLLIISFMFGRTRTMPYAAPWAPMR
jgi:hypothetical protein